MRRSKTACVATAEAASVGHMSVSRRPLGSVRRLRINNRRDVRVTDWMRDTVMTCNVGLRRGTLVADCGMMADRLMVRMVSMVGVACWMSTLRIVVV